MSKKQKHKPDWMYRSVVALATFNIAITASNIWFKLPVAEDKLPRRTIEACVLTDSSAPVGRKSIDAALRSTNNVLRTEGVSIRITERGQYASSSADDLVDYVNQDSTALDPDTFCKKPHTLTVVYSKTPTQLAGKDTMLELGIAMIGANIPTVVIWKNDSKTERFYTTTHEVLHAMGVVHSADSTSMMYYLHLPNQNWSEDVVSNLQSQRTAIYRGMKSSPLAQVSKPIK